MKTKLLLNMAIRLTVSGVLPVVVYTRWSISISKTFKRRLTFSVTDFMHWIASLCNSLYCNRPCLHILHSFT